MSDPKFSFFPNNRADKPTKTLTLEQLVDMVKSGVWAKDVLNLRKTNDEHIYKRLKDKLPAVTISGDFKTRDKFKTLDKRLKNHTGYICLDVDKKDNPRMRTKDLIDRDAVAEFVSAGGEGKKIIYYCKPVKGADEHRRIFDTAINRLAEKGITIKVDPIVKSIASLQYVTFDPLAYFNPKSKVVLQPAKAVERKKVVKGEVGPLLEQVEDYVRALGSKDVTSSYENWMLLLFGLSYSLGEAGRPIMHKICKNYKGYSKLECDEKYDSFLSTPSDQVGKPVTLSTVFHIINEELSAKAKKDLGKKYSITHAVGEATEVADEDSNADLRGLVQWKLILFKKIFDKDSEGISELTAHRLNLNEFEKLLRRLGFYRHEDGYVQITENIVEQVDVPDILRIVTDYIEKEGDYKFIYKSVEYNFSWEELAHFWREQRASSSMYNQVTASLIHWQPNLLKDTQDSSFIPYSNGVVMVDAKSIKVVPYKNIKEQIWKERILPRSFLYSKKQGMFEQFFINVMGRGKGLRQKLASVPYKRGLWYFGYILQGTKRQSTARAWLLYDIMAGNNGRTGKTIIGNAVGKIRSVTIIDGKTLDLKNRFAFQTVSASTEVVFIDDPSKYTSLAPLFNMITGQATFDMKGTKPIVREFKFLIASNWILEAEGRSEAGRQFVSQLDDHYAKTNSLTPIVDEHGKEFFTDWNTKDWSEFDSFCMRALQNHFRAEMPDNTIIGNSAVVRFIQLYEEELFYSLAQQTHDHEKDSSVPTQILCMTINDMHKADNNTKAGKIARIFLTACGAKNLTITTKKVNKLVANFYQWEGKLNYGQYHDEITKRK